MTSDKFARGYLVSSVAVDEAPEGWNAFKLGALFCWADPRLFATKAQADDRWLCFFGHALDIKRPSDTLQAVADRMVKLDFADLLEATDNLAGRFVIFYGNATEHNVVLDATGMRAAFYTLEGPMMVSSHARLIADITGAPKTNAGLCPPPAGVPGFFGPPGRITPWGNIVYLTANVSLNLETRRITRFWPLKEIEATSVEEAADCFIQAAKAQCEHLFSPVTRQFENFLLSLSCGLDSRTTLAVLRDYMGNPVESFSYYRPNVAVRGNTEDVKVAVYLAKELAFRHTTVIEGDASLCTDIMSSHFLYHFAAGAYAYKHYLPQNALHIRSNISEVGRSYFYLKKRPTDGFFTPEHMAFVWRVTDDPKVVECFREWADAVQFWEAKAVDHRDLFCWEHMHPTWFSNVVSESDAAFETHSFFNCRAVLACMCAVENLEDRSTAKTFYRVLEKAWPELLQYPVNPTQTQWEDFLKSRD